MANARIARFITEVAPPQFISVMRQRTSKMLDTIHEEEKEAASINDFSISLPRYTVFSATSSHNASAKSSLDATVRNKHFFKDVQGSCSVFRK